MRDAQFPHKNIGEYLKDTRVSRNESLAEVSGAVEIDIDMLERIEAGTMLPSEDILILLISYLKIAEAQARHLLKLGGYGREEATIEATEDSAAKQIVAILAQDGARINYADQTDVTITKNGVILSFLQPSLDGEVGPVSRIGLSKSHARKLSMLINKALEIHDQPKMVKALPAKTKTRKSR